METTNILVTLGITSIVVIGGENDYQYLRGPKFKRETVDGQVCFDDAVAWFKEQHPEQNKHNCIAATDSNRIFKPLIAKEGYESIGLFVIEKENTVKSGLIIHARSFDDKTKRIFGNTDIIKLV